MKNKKRFIVEYYTILVVVEVVIESNEPNRNENEHTKKKQKIM